METKTFKKGEIIFRKGDPADCMYEVYSGKAGVYSGYGTPEEKLLAEYYPDQYFGEMGLLDHAPRSATVAALSDDTVVGFISEDSFGEFFRENPSRVFMVMQQLSRNLRRRTNEYIDVCREIRDLSGKEETK